MVNASDDSGSNEHGSHYFDESPRTDSRPTTWTLEVDGRSLTMRGDTGVFSADGLDKGTRVLLRWAESADAPGPPPGSHLCDLGCGSGAIALTLAVRHPDCTVHAIDVNERARRLCAENARANALANVVVSHPDEVDESVRFAILWSNPPIRIGKSALHALLRRWLPRLTPDGRAHMVVSKNLGGDSLVRWLNEERFVTTKVASSKGFRVLETRARSDQ